VSDLTFSNLVVGKTYRVSLKVSTLTVAAIDTLTNANCNVYHDGSTVAFATIQIDRLQQSATDTVRLPAYAVGIFVATTTTVTVGLAVNAPMTIEGNGSVSETHLIVEELNDCVAESSAF